MLTSGAERRNHGGPKKYFWCPNIQVLYDGHAVHEEVLSTVQEGEIYLLNRHAQIVEGSKIVLKVKLKAQNSKDAEMDIFIKRALY